MSSQKPTKPQSQSPSTQLPMLELKQRTLNSLSKLSDRDTHHLAIEDLTKTIQTLQNDAVPTFLNTLLESLSLSPSNKPAVKKETLRLISHLCASHSSPALAHLPKIVTHIVKKVKDPDSLVREACRDAIGNLAQVYLKGDNVGGNNGDNGGNVGGGDGLVSVFVKPLFEMMNEHNKVAQGGACMCLSKMVECSGEGGLSLGVLVKVCGRVCKYLGNPHFIAKGAVLQVVASLSKVGAIAPQNLEPLLQSIHECLGSTDWATRKAAADTLIALSVNLSNITPEGAASTVNVLEACRFDKIKPVRDSMTEALQLWKNIAGKGDRSSDETKASSPDTKDSESADPTDRENLPNLSEKGNEKSVKNSSNGSSPTDSNSKDKGNNVSDKGVGTLRKKAPALTDKEMNPEFFQKLETRASGDIEVIVSQRCINPTISENKEVREPKNANQSGQEKYDNIDRGTILDENDSNNRESSSMYADLSRNPGQYDGSMNSKGNWLAVQRQLLQLERQQSNLVNMLQDFMGGSQDNMLTLEDRVRGLERVVEDMARELSISTSRRFEGSSNRPLGKYNGFPDYPGGKLGRGNDGRVHFGERFQGRSPSWRSDPSDAWDFHGYPKNGQMGSRRAVNNDNMDIRSARPENEAEAVGSRRAWEKGPGPVRFGEGPSARSVWQASKDEATLEAIRVAGDDNGVARNARVAIPEMTAEALADDDGVVQERDPVWTSWSNAMDALHVGDMDTAFAEVLSTGDDALLVKLIDKTGPVIDQLSNEVTSEVLHAVSQLLTEPNLFDMCLFWIQQLTDLIMDNGADVVGIPMEVKREILFNLHEASSSVELPEDWEGSAPDQLLLQLASAWNIDLRNFEK